MINYSFIIPHHNSSGLLNRCLDSIPQREDIEIIVVDDNSDADKKPQVKRPDVKLVFIDAEHSKGAGRARNCGLKVARGKWIVFADADDFFEPGFLDVLDNYKDTDNDVVYHPAKAVDTLTLEEMPALLKRHNEYFLNYDGTQYSLDLIRFHLHSPWWKMVSREFIEKHNILFEEVPKGNDVFFSYQVGYFAKNIKIEQCPIYVYTFNRQGITNGRKNKRIYISVIQGHFKNNEFYRFIGHEDWKKSNLRTWFRIIKKDGFLIFFQTLISFLKNYREIYANRMYYVEELNKCRNNPRKI